MKKYLVIAALAATGHAAPALAESCTAITAIPATISTPGKYCLTQDYSVNAISGNSITIATNGVTLDCDGHALRNTSTSATGNANGISLASRNDIVIRNCRVIGGYRNGIFVNQANNVANKNYYITIADNYVAGPLLNGILAFGSAVEVTGNRVYDIGGLANSNAFGIHLGGSTVSNNKFHVVKDNLVAGTNSPYLSGYGIYSEATVGGIFIHNAVSGTSSNDGGGFGAYGIRLGGTFNRITDNHVVGLGGVNDFGIYTVDANSACYDNYIRATTATATCNASLGNY